MRYHVASRCLDCPFACLHRLPPAAGNIRRAPRFPLSSRLDLSNLIKLLRSLTKSMRAAAEGQLALSACFEQFVRGVPCHGCHGYPGTVEQTTFTLELGMFCL